MTTIGGDPRITERCPFCGAKGIIVRDNTPDSTGRLEEWIECSNQFCQAMGPAARASSTHAVAIHFWNRRIA